MHASNEIEIFEAIIFLCAVACFTLLRQFLMICELSQGKVFCLTFSSSSKSHTFNQKSLGNCFRNSFVGSARAAIACRNIFNFIFPFIVHLSHTGGFEERKRDIPRFVLKASNSKWIQILCYDFRIHFC